MTPWLNSGCAVAARVPHDDSFQAEWIAFPWQLSPFEDDGLLLDEEAGNLEYWLDLNA